MAGSGGEKSFLAMVEMLQKEFQMTIVMASHDLEDIMEKADQCIFLKDGQILAEGIPVHAAEKLWEQGKDMEAFCRRPFVCQKNKRNA